MRKSKVVLLMVLALVVLSCVSCTSATRLYNVTLDLNGGDGLVATDFIDGTKLVKPSAEPVKTGYYFAGWYSDEDLTEECVFGGEITEDVHIYAAWTVRVYKAYFFVGSWTEEIVVDIEDGAVEMPVVSREGYEFIGWYADAALTEEADLTEELTDDVRFYAKWRAIRYNITYIDDYGGIFVLREEAARSYTVEDDVVLYDPIVTEETYTFLGWRESGEDGSEYVRYINKGSTGDRIFTAVYA